MSDTNDLDQKQKNRRSIIQQFKVIFGITFLLMVLGLAAIGFIVSRISVNLSYQYLRNSTESFSIELRNTYLTASNINALLTIKDPFIQYLYSEDPSAGSALNEMASEIVYLRNVNPMITDISVIGIDRKHPVMIKKDSLDAIEQSLDESGKTGITCTITETPMYGRYPYTARFLSYVLNVYRKGERRGAVVISFSPTTILSQAAGTDTLSMDYAFLDSKGDSLNLGSGDNYTRLVREGQNLLNRNEAGALLSPDNLLTRMSTGRYLTQITYLPELDGYLLSGIDYQQVIAQYRSLWLLYAAILMVIAIFFAYTAVSFYRSFVLPLRMLSANLYEQQGRYLHPAFRDIPGCLELTRINHDIYETQQAAFELNRKIFDTQQLLYEQDRQQKLTELAMFRSQVNPHFLANALELVSSCGDQVHDSRVREISSAISRIYRYSAHITEPATIQDELNIINDYSYIQTLRYGPALSIISYFPEDTRGLATIRMLLQPLVENSITHGFRTHGYEGTIYIGAHVENGILIIDVRDDGSGIPEDRLAELNSRLEASAEEIPGHIGLFNTNSRIKLIFGEEYGLTVLSDENNGTVVRIRYPAVETMPQREQPHKTTAAVTAP